MNCKPGDLAFVINEDPACKENIGRIVRVLRRSSARHAKHGEWDIEPTSADFLIYDPSTKRLGRWGECRWAWVVMPDADLRPIRDPGDDARDETLDWRPVPHKEIA